MKKLLIPTMIVCAISVLAPFQNAIANGDSECVVLQLDHKAGQTPLQDITYTMHEQIIGYTMQVYGSGLNTCNKQYLDSLTTLVGKEVKKVKQTLKSKESKEDVVTMYVNWVTYLKSINEIDKNGNSELKGKYDAAVVKLEMDLL